MLKGVFALVLTVKGHDGLNLNNKYFKCRHLNLIVFNIS
jgi:hypothetical protein